MNRSSSSLAISFACALAALATCSQAADSPYTFERGFPATGDTEKAYAAADLRRAIEAYKFFYGTVATEAVMQQGQAAGGRANEVGIAMATSPRQQFGGANADTPYAIATVDLMAAGPMVVEVPPGPFIGFVDDHNMRWVQDMGTIGPEKGQGGKHLILPPDFAGAVPEGYYTGRSKTWKVVVFVRMMPVGGDVAKALQAVNGIKVYPLAKAGQPVTHCFIDVSAKTMPLPILTWEDNLDYWRQLHAVIQTETVPAEFRPMLGMLAQLGIVNGKRFNSDARTRRILEEAARTALFDAMKRKEVYATTGGRMTVRVFGGWDFAPEDEKRSDFAAQGYERGVPMGGDLTKAPAGKSPTFLVRAMRDVEGANLDRIQIIKGWLGEDGNTSECIYALAVSDGRKIGADGRCKTPVGNTVDVSNATYKNTIGGALLMGYWKDPEFKANQRAFYCTRVIEIPPAGLRMTRSVSA